MTMITTSVGGQHMREFRTAVKNANGSNDEVPFSLDGHQFVAVRPKEWVMLETAAVQADGVPPGEQAAAVIGFVKSVFAEPGRTTILARLRDPADELDVEDMRPIIEWLTEEWAGRPTG
jgi:hypothetical protein